MLWSKIEQIGCHEHDQIMESQHTKLKQDVIYHSQDIVRNNLNPTLEQGRTKKLTLLPFTNVCQGKLTNQMKSTWHKVAEILSGQKLHPGFVPNVITAK